MTKKVIGLFLLLAVASIAVACGADESKPNPRSTTVSDVIARPIATQAPSRVLESFRCDSSDSEYGFVYVIGMVRNASSSQKLENVMAVGRWFDSNDGFITSDDALLEFNPLMPGQSSEFKTFTTYNPLMKKCSVVFKTLFGGSVAVVRQTPSPTALPKLTSPLEQDLSSSARSNPTYTPGQSVQPGVPTATTAAINFSATATSYSATATANGNPSMDSPTQTPASAPMPTPTPEATPTPRSIDDCAQLVPGADLQRCDFRFRDLSGLDLSFVNLSNTILVTASLRNTILVGADLSGADLSSTDLTGADLQGATIEGARISDSTAWFQINWENTTCLDGLNSSEHRNSLHPTGYCPFAQVLN